MFVFTEPIGRRGGRVAASSPPSARREANAVVSPSSSTASPSRVPEPCASRYPASAGSAPAERQARAITRACAAALGVLRVAAARPLCSTALPRSTACTGAPSARARPSVVSSSTAPPSPDTVPSASASKARQRPEGDTSSSSPAASRAGSAPQRTLTPPARAYSASPAASSRLAWWTAISELLQPVSIA
ncbi:hypothetical protein SRIMM317S_05582 [Streptomyces rimosus subsp. rimosus]